VVVLCVSVYYQASCYTPGLYLESKVPLGFLQQDVHCVDFVETLRLKVLATFADNHCLLRF
jgi:hypothetical protein